MGGSKLSLLSWYVKLSCYECESSPVSPGTAQSRQYRDADWRQIGTFWGGKYSLHSLILSLLQPKIPKQAPQPPPGCLIAPPWLHPSAEPFFHSSITPWKCKSGSCLPPQRGQGLAADASARFVKQDIKITPSSRDAQAFPLLFHELLHHSSAWTESLFSFFFLCSASNLEGVGWQGQSRAGFLLLAFLLPFTPAMLSPAPKSPLQVGEGEGRKMQSLLTLRLSDPISLYCKGNLALQWTGDLQREEQKMVESALGEQESSFSLYLLWVALFYLPCFTLV